jgi:hypothetical protein
MELQYRFSISELERGIGKTLFMYCLPFTIIWVHPRVLLEVSVTHDFSFLCCVFVFVLFVFVVCLVYPMLLISLDCPFLIAPSFFLTFISTRGKVIQVFNIKELHYKNMYM